MKFAMNLESFLEIQRFIKRVECPLITQTGITLSVIITKIANMYYTINILKPSK